MSTQKQIGFWRPWAWLLTSWELLKVSWAAFLVEKNYNPQQSLRCQAVLFAPPPPPILVLERLGQSCCCYCSKR